MSAPQQKIQNKDLQKIFKNFDKDNSGFIDLNQIKQVVSQLGQTMTQQQFVNAIKEMDTNGDKKISFQQFKFWWIHSKIGKMRQIVKLKFKALKLINQANNKLLDSNVNFFEKYSSQKASHQIRLGFGQDKGKFQLNFEAIFGQPFKKQLQEINSLVSNVKQHTLTLLIIIKTKKSEEAKKALDNFINDISNKFPQQSLFKQILKMLKIQCIVKENKLIISASTTQGDELASNFLQLPQQLFSKLGQNFFIKLSANFKIKQGIQTAFSKIKFVKWFCKGFSSSIKIQSNPELLKKIRKLLLKQISQGDSFFGFLAMIQSSKFNLKLKNPEDVDKLFQSLGINQLSESTPHFEQLLQEIVIESNVRDWQDKQNKYHHLFKFCDILNQFAEQQVNIKFVLPFTIINLMLKIPGGSLVFNKAFSIGNIPKTTK